MGVLNSGVFSSSHCEWSTPQDLFDELDREFHFTLDPCATGSNAKCEKFFTLADDGLSRGWAGETVFMNPPYGRVIKDWVRKAWEESLRGAVVVCLIPARTDTSYWHDYCFKYGVVRFLRGRVKFCGRNKDGIIVKASAPFPSAIVVFGETF